MLRGLVIKRIGLFTLIVFSWMMVTSPVSFGRQSDLEQNPQKTAQQQERDASPPSPPRVKVKEGEAKPPKKFPWLFVAAGAVVAGVVFYLLLSKKPRDSEVDNWQYTGPVVPSYDTDVLGIEWIRIPAGEFLMGDNFGEGSSFEHPVHPVYLDGYSISKFEVTFDMYEKFCLERGWSVPYDQGWGRGDRPVIHLNWYSAKAFCDWLSAKTGATIHLPTEAQWEKAARGTDQRRYPWGNADLDCSLLNYHRCYDRTMPVGSFPAGVSPYGVHDMAGNVAEWCQDFFGSSYYSESPYTNPQGPNSGTWKILRGGSGRAADAAHMSSLRSASRFRNAPYRDFSDVGIRLVKE